MNTHTKQRKLRAEEIEERLDIHVDAVLSSRRTAAEPARSLAKLKPEQQSFVLQWVAAIAQSNAEMAYQFAAHADKAFNQMDCSAVEAWVIQAMDAYDKNGLSSGIAQLNSVEQFVVQRRERTTGLAFEEISRILENYIQGLNGRTLKLEAGDEVFTDTETLFLPGLINRFATRDENFRLFKAMAVHQWAQTWFGTWRLDLIHLTQNLAETEKRIRVFHALESLRLDACIGRELPGVHREMQALRRRLDRQDVPPGWAGFRDRLQSQGATAHDSWTLVARAMNAPEPSPCCYQGMLFPARVLAVAEQRKKRDKKALRTALAKLGEQHTQEQRDETSRNPLKLTRVVVSDDLPERFAYELLIDDKPVQPPEELRGLMASIIQDLGEIPDDYLAAAGPAAYDPATQPTQADPDEVWRGTYHEKGALLYNEWDHARRHYRKDWCVLRERDVQPHYDDFVARTLHKYGGLRKSLRRTFEVLRGEEKLLRKQPHGDDIDIDALVEAYADVARGREMSSRVFTKFHKVERDIAVMLMVDMSGSTKGWINTAERESLVLLCEALETLGDRYAIYGFSGMTRKRCELFRIKRFDEPYDALVRARISGILPQDYTRMGVAIRHLSRLLNEVQARTKLLLTLSDGKPDDYTGYRGEYGIEDTRQSLFEARREGIHPFCITIDDQAGDYLPHMYGAVNYVVIDDVKKLPLKVSDIYRRLTT